MLNANKKTSQAKTEVTIGFDGKTIITVLGEKSFNGMVIAETKLWWNEEQMGDGEWRHSAQTSC